jgi:hypothetical protein
MLVKYLRDENRKPYGCIVAVGPGMVGYSVCNPKDTFNKELGCMIAAGRTMTIGNDRLCDSPHVEKRVPRKMLGIVLDEIAAMDERSMRYYKE